MASMNLPIHVPPDANPEHLLRLVETLDEHPELSVETIADLTGFLASEGLSTRTEVQQAAVQLGLLGRADNGIKLTPLGCSLVQLKETIRKDILHFLFYTGWRSEVPNEFLPSWAYRAVCDDYWARQQVELERTFLDRRISEIVSQTEQYFRGIGIVDFNEVSFGRKSLTGVHKWLEGLDPPVIEDDTFARRAFCPPELLLLALGWVVGREGLPDTDVLLSHETREAICRVCLLEPTAFDRALDWMIPIFPRVIAPGTTAGFYGRFVRLHKLPRLADVIR